MAGLETPRIGDFVSGHWGHMLEVVTDWQDLDKYMKKAKQYFAQFQ